MSAGSSGRSTRPDLRHLVQVPDGVGERATPATDLEGADLFGAPAAVRVDDAPRTLLLFLSSQCDGCRPFWPAAAEPGSLGLSPGDAIAVVARDAGPEDRAALARLAPAEVAVVLSEAAWSAYRVAGAPFFVLVDRAAAAVATEGVAWSVPQVAADVRRAHRHRTDAGS